jgi:quinol monooxygenase YgiN
MTNLIIVARVEAKSGHEAALVAAQTELVQVVRQQAGCLLYELHESLDQPGTVIFFERWTDQASWERHMRGTHMDAFRAKAGNWIGVFDLLRMQQVA